MQWNDKYNINDIANIDSIAPFAFASSNVTSIKIPERIKHLPNYCFLNCKLPLLKYQKELSICQIIVS
ncbi:hypothetical protein DXA83_24825 [Bacteroides thetaiotaomicron]|nr:hypothetical protein DXA83_24825 [Bacteroides thetaiotaomicron]